MAIQKKIDINNFLDESQSKGLINFLFENNIAIFILVDYIKAKEWPYRGEKLNNEPLLNIPLVWAIFYSEDRKNINIDFEIHPTKCFPNLYQNINLNCSKYPTPIIAVSKGTLCGCLRHYVTINKKKYHVKAPEYCSIFGIPDDCYDSFFENRMLQLLKSKQEFNIWCYEKNEYLQNIVQPQINIKYMKGEFLPNKYFIYVDKSINFLKGIFKGNDLKNLNQVFWYFDGKDFINERNLDNAELNFRFEEKSIDIIIKRLIFEFIRQLLLLKNRDEFKNYVPLNYPQLDTVKFPIIKQDLKSIIELIELNSENKLNNILKDLGDKLNNSTFKSSRFLVFDVEYIHIIFPTGKDGRSFNFPCMFSSILWEGPRKGLKMYINPLILPCNFCDENCNNFKNRNFKFDCLVFAYEFVENQVSFKEELLTKYDNFKIYSFGKNDIFQLEQSDNFFSNSFESRAFFRRNRKRSRRIINISIDLSESSKSLEEIEKEYIEKWITGWSREDKHININRRFMTKWSSNNWRNNYFEAIKTCVDDSISTFLYLLYKNYKL